VRGGNDEVASAEPLAHAVDFEHRPGAKIVDAGYRRRCLDQVFGVCLEQLLGELVRLRLAFDRARDDNLFFLLDRLVDRALAGALADTFRGQL
jgi:hypothetical protein